MNKQLYDIAEIEDAIKAEIEATPKYYDFKVIKSERDRDLWKITINPSVSYADGKLLNVVLDDSFEGAAAWWAGPPKGAGDVLTVVPEDEKIIIRFTTSDPPRADGLIRIYPPNYLEALLTIWNDLEWAKKSLKLSATIRESKIVTDILLSGERFPWLRKRQKESFTLAQYRDGFLWGPPGTGKTTTLGVLLAEFLLSKPGSRVLLLSTTNHAVDQAIVSVDKALDKVGSRGIKNNIFRIGNHFIATNYKGREHLIPVKDQSLTIKLSKLETQRPPSSDIHAYSDWKRKVEYLRQSIRNQSGQVLAMSRLASMTTTRAAFDFLNLKDQAPYDLIVFDEASQVSLVHALALSPLGKQRLFAGDPKQLSPIVRSEKRESKTWLGNSAFSLMKPDGENTCLLNEQSRMAPPICNLVSHVFYGGDLVVAEECNADIRWLEERKFKFGKSDGNAHVYLKPIDEEGTWSTKFKGPIRYKSAEVIADLLKAGIQNNYFREDQVIVLTPFRAQRALLKMKFSHAGLRKTRISTVHRAQGSESSIVIFDPAQGNNKFLIGEEAKRLINVALSRAKGKLILTLSSEDFLNPLFQQIANIINYSSNNTKYIPIPDFFNRPDFPGCVIGKFVRIANHVGKVEEVTHGGEKIVFVNFQTGKKHEFIIDIMKKNLKN